MTYVGSMETEHMFWMNGFEELHTTNMLLRRRMEGIGIGIGMVLITVTVGLLLFFSPNAVHYNFKEYDNWV